MASISRFDLDNMADENVPALAPTRSDDQILPFAAWIYVDILQNINFFRAFTPLASVPAIYIQQFWNTLTYEAKTRAYSFQLDETRFVLYANLLREALEITPIDQTHQFVSPPSGDAIMDFVNELGQDFWTFLTDKANLGSPTKKGRKDKPHVIPYCWFTKLIIYHLGRIHNLHQRFKSPLHLAKEDLCLGNLKFIPKGEEDEVFRMLIPNELITDNIRNAPYYNAYMEMVAKHDQKIAAKKGGKKKPVTAKQLKPKPVKEKSSKPAPAPKPKMSLESFQAQSQAHVGDAEIGADTNKTNSGGDTEILQIGEEQGDDIANMVNLEEKAAEIDEGQAGSDLGRTPES
ncbi:hypothetical protein Tco_0540092 [Tanacetum coccineum]